jgi:hypothetical protein
MKTSRFALFVAVLAAGSLTTFAQGPQGPSTGLNPAMTKLFGAHTAFSTKAEMQAKGGPAGDMSMSMEFALLDGKTRSDIDMTTMKSAQLPPNAVEAMQQMGMGRMVGINDPKANTMMLIYPGLESYLEMPVPPAEAAANKEEYQIEKTELGKETVAGRATAKYKVTMTDSKGAKKEALLWSAPDLKDFPVKMETTEQGATVTITYSDVKFAKPDAALFAAPAGFTKHASQQGLMQAAMMRMMEGAGGPPGKGTPKGKAKGVSKDR